MTEKQKQFCDEYLTDCNAARSYKAVYKTTNDETARVNGSKLLTKTNIKKYIDEQLQKIHSEKTASAQEIMEYLTAVMRGESQSEVVVVEGTGDGCSSARLVRKAPDEKERLKSAELLGKRFGLFKETVELGGNAVIIVEGEDKLE
jgi:phage terminase small subunit